MHDESVLQILDQVARRFMQLNDGIHYQIAQTPAEFEAVFRLRYRTVIEKGWAKPDDYPDGLERDSFDDDRTHQMMALKDDDLVGTGRVVLPSPDRPLPAEEAFNVVIEPHLQVVDVGRAIVEMPYQSIHQQIFLGLMGYSWVLARERGYCELCGAVTPGMMRLYRMIGFHVDTITSYQPYWGETRALFKVNLERSAQSFQSRSELFWKRLSVSK